MFLALGTWQLQRRAWKLDLIERVESRVGAPAVAPPGRAEWGRLDPDAIAYRRVRLSGRFDDGRSTLVQALTERGAGFWVLTPLRTDPDSSLEGATVLVNRGFVPTGHRARADRAASEGAVTVTGLVRLTEPDGSVLRGNDPAADRWYSRDVAAIAAARGLPKGDVAPYFVDADATPNPGGLPVGGLTVIAFRNHHLVYALTWYALALMSAGALIYALRSPPAQA
ncbi:SURF1 family protein [Methylobacterium sp. Leaf118]|uniref:SURF1 family protein n=1 Tax=Methylobacterium sp. Leaf118 TaxID=2876562 RepID=UPI003FA5A101